MLLPPRRLPSSPELAAQLTCTAPPDVVNLG